MPLTINCTDCGHTEQSDDGTSKTCPACEGIMTIPPKKKYQAKSTSLEEEARAKKNKNRSDDGEKIGGDCPCDGRAAEALDLNPGFEDKALLEQVEGELSHGEVLHYICRPSKVIAEKQGWVFTGIGGFVFLAGIIGGAWMFTMMRVPTSMLIAPGFFVLFGIVFFILGAGKKNQAEKGWYAVTDRRAITFEAPLFGNGGICKSYAPAELRKMWVQKSMWLQGGGDLIFKTEVTTSVRTVRDPSGSRRNETTQSKQHFGFLGIDNVKDVERLIHEVLLAQRDDDDD